MGRDLRVRQVSDGREALRDGSDTPYPLAAGDRVVALGDQTRGTVLTVDAAADIVTIQWGGCTDTVRYPQVALGVNLRKVLPWER